MIGVDKGKAKQPDPHASYPALRFECTYCPNGPDRKTRGFLAGVLQGDEIGWDGMQWS